MEERTYSVSEREHQQLEQMKNFVKKYNEVVREAMKNYNEEYNDDLSEEDFEFIDLDDNPDNLVEYIYRSGQDVMIDREAGVWLITEELEDKIFEGIKN